MPRIDPIQQAFNAGEFGPYMFARSDLQKYHNALRKSENVISLPQGGAMRRPGTRYVASVKDASATTYLVPFEFSTTQAYMIEAGNAYFRFFRNQGQISVANTDAAVTNGTFDSNITNWDDNSTGSAAIAFALLGSTDDGTFSVASNGSFGFGDASASGPNRKNLGLQFVAGGGDVLQVRIKTFSTHTANGNCVARLYSDSSGSPGTQTGGDSDTVSVNAASTEFTFTWSSNTPTLTASTTYWVIIANTDTTLNTTLETIPDQGSGYASGAHDTITSIADGTNFASGEARIEVLIDDGSGTNGALALQGSTTDTCAAEQDITTTNTDQEHVLQFRVIGAPSDTITFRVGAVSTGMSILADLTLGVGYHAIAFTPDVSPFYVQFEHKTDKTIYIDDVALIDNAPAEIVTPYTTAQLANLRYVQSADTLYLCHSAHPVYKLLRRGHPSWSLEEVNWTDGPYLAANATTTTLDPSATTGLGITVTASAKTGINSDAGFSSNDIGRLIRYSDDGVDWFHMVITDVTDELNVTADILGTDLDAHTASTHWRLGAWSATTGYPQVATFHEQRLALANTTTDPDKFWLSQSGDFENMRPDSVATGGGVETLDDDALDYRISSDQVNAIRWMRSGTKLMIGTGGGEWIVDSVGAVLTPTDVDAKQQTSMGSANIEPVQIDNAALFVQRGKRRIHEYAFNFEADGFKSPDMTILANHITQNRISRLAYSASPHSQALALRGDGRLAVLTYKREQDVVGWDRWTLGGTFSSGIAVVEDVAIIPGNNGAGQTQDSTERDEIWMVVKRTVNSSTVRYVEFLEQDFEGPDRNEYTSDSTYQTALLADQPDMYFADSLLTYDSTATATITGLSHLEGETVKVLADGAVHPDCTVSSGSITLDYTASVVQVGLGYFHDIEFLKLDFGNPAGSAIGKDQRVRRVTLVLHETGALKIGATRATLKEISLRDTTDSTDTAVPLFTGEYLTDIEGDFIVDPRVIIRNDDPTPFTLLAIVPDVQVSVP